MTSMRQVWRALPGPSPIKCECCMFFGSVLPIFPALLWLLGKPHDAHDAAAGRLRGAVNPNKIFKIITGCGQCLWFNDVVDCFSLVFDSSLSQSSQNGVPIVLMMLLYEARARARLVQEHHQRN